MKLIFTVKIKEYFVFDILIKLSYFVPDISNFVGRITFRTSWTPGTSYTVRDRLDLKKFPPKTRGGRGRTRRSCSAPLPLSPFSLT